MNRVLKFRVWDKKAKEFGSDILTALVLQAQIATNTIRDNDKYSCRKDFILQQFTGLLDKNNKEIYEGDILKFKYWNRDKGFWTDKSTWNYCTGTVEYCKEYMGFCFHYGDNCSDDIRSPFSDLIDEREYEILGNIFETPKLAV